jgi:hypothetical protein
MVECPAGNWRGFFMRFTIRDVLWLTVVIGMALAWWLHYREYSIWEERGVSLDIQLRATGWNVNYGDGGLPELIPPPEFSN